MPSFCERISILYPESLAFEEISRASEIDLRFADGLTVLVGLISASGLLDTGSSGGVKIGGG